MHVDACACWRLAFTGEATVEKSNALDALYCGARERGQSSEERREGTALRREVTAVSDS